ncbi:exotoxin beta-grasp domain-containing protein [Staphylococcus lutrae]|uniref:Exotoxin n=1 Tax=Staphylococcus lutrae TaxID=155085 RepID=A0AAC9WMQ4_9STAP|nr:hypothetical protein [Staphylococcus lutrae]ARJ51332.1 hypothetical protein B5P37_08425 [Staphylococcus lutrae]PNZ35842.1 exotoxin [Staphylococcus lutrae]
MKMTTFLKATLAAGILATGSYAGGLLPTTAHAEVQKGETAKELIDYYSKPYFEYKNLTGYYENGRLDLPIPNASALSVKLVGKDLEKYNAQTKTYDGLDVFVVPEGTGKQATTNSIGGVTKKNKQQYFDVVSSPEILIYKKAGFASEAITLRGFDLYKEEMTLKELDFRLRQMLIKDYGLYKYGSTEGEIIIFTDYNEKDRYTFELHKKLQEHRMSDVIDTRKIKEISIGFRVRNKN